MRAFARGEPVKLSVAVEVLGRALSCGRLDFSRSILHFGPAISAARSQWSGFKVGSPLPGGTAITTWICADGPLWDRVDIPSQL